MHRLVVVFLLTLISACAGPGREDDDAALRRAAAQNELERECRQAALQGRYDPHCPAQHDAFAPPPRQGPLTLPVEPPPAPAPVLPVPNRPI